MHKSRFFSLLSLFSFAMLLLVTGDNLLILLFGWECVGIISYLLVNFWFTRIFANKAAKSALYQNKIGDMFFIQALIMSKAIFSDLSLSTIFSLTPYINSNLLFILILSFILASSAKSALIGFHSWQPKAMEGCYRFPIKFRQRKNLVKVHKLCNYKKRFIIKITN